MAEKRQISLLQEATGEVLLQGSDILLYRLLFNLVENAIRYNKEGGAVRVSAEERADTVEILVQDTGSGIPVADRETVFQPFFRVDKSRSRRWCGRLWSCTAAQSALQKAMHRGQPLLSPCLCMRRKESIIFPKTVVS